MADDCTGLRAETVAEDTRMVLGTQPADYSRILSIYLYGSLLWGGFDPRTSDVDLIVVVASDHRAIESYEQVGRFAAAMPSTYRLDISTSLIDQIEQAVPCRPFILQAAADHGWLIYGAPTLPRGRPLDKMELLQAIDFELRQLSRNVAGARDECWEEIIRRQIKAHFLRLSQLVHSWRDEVPFTAEFGAALDQAVRFFPSLADQVELLCAAVDVQRGHDRVQCMMRSLLEIRRAVQRTSALDVLSA